MSKIDAYEYERPRYKKRKWGQPRMSKERTAKEIQLQLKLYGGTTEKDKGVPFDDPLPF